MKLKFNMTQVATAIASVVAMIASVTPMLPASTPLWVRLLLGALGAGLQVWAHAIHSDPGKKINITQTFGSPSEGDQAAIDAMTNEKTPTGPPSSER